jgi:hypothetical protein
MRESNIGEERAYVVSLVDVQICLSVSFVVTPNSSSHARPWLLECKNTFDIISMNLLPGNGIDDCGLDAEEWERGGSWLGGCDTCERSNDIGASLGLPVCLLSSDIFCLSGFKTYINNVSFLLSNNFKIPLPNLSSNWFTN